eukprot:CAMPEP_0117426576 /NCGR_PEP_ID=MMETSP0758-20121206/6644_1 /TAXON_ID=63605 /ORGANISM="Percolomonas cosmopolitus, Strain AE-1 (ATCC 50343)" /LENGTH=405 /DNA_ID=CAMNT_0005211791 /DNA_START=216 /DNA_END=1433 /DNA_ORIENTATION=+
MKVLIIGAGGLGCDLLKNLAMSGFKDIHIIDMDTIDTSNLNRQFLFREADVDKPKSHVAAAFVANRVADVNIVAHNCAIQEYDSEFYMQFNLVVCGLDSIQARRWINSQLVSIAQNYEKVIPMIDGGTEGFKGQARMIIPGHTACFECTMDLFTPQEEYQLCTLANIPRQPHHCVAFAKIKLWGETTNKKTQDGVLIKDGVDIDSDNSAHIQWLYEVALKRANDYGIKGVTYRFTQGVIKHIIPAIASTNAIIASACTNEALKYATAMAGLIDNYMTYAGDEGINTYTYAPTKKEECPVCSEDAPPKEIKVNGTMTLRDFMDYLNEEPSLQLKKPIISFYDDDENRKIVYDLTTPQYSTITNSQLDKPIQDIFESYEHLYVLDAIVFADVTLILQVEFNEVHMSN